MSKLFAFAVGLMTAIAASGSAAASMRCDKDGKNCRDTNAGTVNAAASAKQKVKSPREASSGMATGRRTYKPTMR